MHSFRLFYFTEAAPDKRSYLWQSQGTLLERINQMDLAELKKQNEEEEAAALAETKEPEVEVEPEAEPEPEPDPEPELDEDDNPIEKQAAEPWMDDGEGKKTLPDVPVDTHIKMKTKLKGRVSEVNEENEKLRAEIAALKTQTQPKPTELKRPIIEDFGD